MKNLNNIDPRDLVTSTSEIYLAAGNTVAASTRWKRFSNLPGLEYQPNAEHKETMINVRGVKRPGKSYTTGLDPKFIAKANELNQRIIDFVFFADEDEDFGAESADNAQAALSAVAGQSFDFDEGADGVGVGVGERTDILTSTGGRLRDVSAIVLTGVNLSYGSGEDQAQLVEGVDYELDGLLGQIVWLKAINNDVISTSITAPAITADSSSYMVKRKPNKVGSREMMARMYWYDQDETAKLKLAYEDVLMRVKVIGGFNSDGEADAEPEIEFTPLTEGRLLNRA